MISPLHQFSLLLVLIGAVFNQFTLPQIFVGAVVIVVVLAVVQHWALRRLNADPADDMDTSATDKDAEILGDVPIRSKVGTPRARRLQPLRSSDEPMLSGAEILVPADSLAMAGAAAFAKPKESSRAGDASLPPVGTGLAPATESKPVENKRAESASKPIILPPLSPAEVAGAGSKPPGSGALSDDKSRESIALPPLSVNLPPIGGAVTKPTEAKDQPAPVAPPATPLSTDKPAAVPPAAPAGTAAPATPAETDDLKKRKSPPTVPDAEPTRTGLIIIPKDGEAKAEAVPAPATSTTQSAPSVKPAETPAAAKEEISAAKPITPQTEPAKQGGRTRIFLPANLPATSGKPVEEAAPTATAKPGSEPPASVIPVPPVESKAPAAESPAKVESKDTPEVKTEPKIEAKVEGKPEPKVETQPEPKAQTKAENPPETKKESPVTPVAPVSPSAAEKITPPASQEPAKPEPQTATGWLRGILRRSDAEEPAKPTPPAPTPKAEEKKPVAPAPAPAPPASTPAAEIKPPAPVVEPVKTPAAEPKPPTDAAPAAAKPAAGTPPTSTPLPIPILPAESAPPRREVSVSIPQPTMAQTESTTNVPANSRASAQLTLGFEITSLQLTPFFKLGGVQLKPLSNVVGLHLIATQSADNPLAAGISFQIDKVELKDTHISAITLKPLQDAQAATIPQSKLQVDTIQIGQGGDGAPISVTSSGSTPTAVQLLATFTIAAMEFTPAFEIGLLRLEPTSNSVLLRLSTSSRPASLDLPPAFEVSNVQLGEDSQISALRLTPGGKPA